MMKRLAIVVLLLIPTLALAAFPTQSVLLNGSSQYFTRAKTGSTNLYATSDFTWECYVKSSTLPGAGIVQTFYSQSWKTGANLSFAIQLDNTGGTYSMRFRGGSTGNQDFNVTLGSLGAVTTGTWYHLAMVYTASTHTAEAFKNFVSTGSNSTVSSSIFNGTDEVVVGAEGDASNKWNGRMSVCRFWKTTRTAVQLQNSSCDLLGATTNLGAEWSLNNTANDNSGNSNTLTAVGTPTYSTDVPTPSCPSPFTLPTFFSSFWF